MNNVVEPLAKLRDPNVQERWSAIQDLRQLGNEIALEPFLDLALHDPDGDVRREATWGIGEFVRAGKTTFVQISEPLLIALGNTDPVIRGNAVVALSRIHQEGDFEQVVAPKILALLHDSAAYVRLQAAWWMLKNGDSRAKADLESLLTDPDADVREMATRALETIDIQ